MVIRQLDSQRRGFTVKMGDCKLCLAKSIEYTKSDIVPKWFIKEFKDGPNGGHYVDLLRDKPGLAYFYDDEALCKTCNNERFSPWEGLTKPFYDHYIAGGNASLDYGPWFFRFSTSVSWRVLTFLRRVGDHTKLNDSRIAEASEAWRSFLMSDKPHELRGHSQHLLTAAQRT